jgi:hypothetical protein
VRDDGLDPNAEPADEVDAGLDRKANFRLERLGLTLDYLRPLMPGHADAVAGGRRV